MADIQDEIDQARQIAAYGFERGFDFALDYLGDIASTTKSKEGKQTIELALKMFETMRPGLMEEMPAWFTFNVVKLPDGSEKITLQ